ncbi:MAG: hypothetical protein DHS20C11_30340 [Lysobacteraceae bacterium]|nr:MAG: hypothetical protein DHS20C11_30340 [Xanthomonadaceae bacterium]
MYKATFMNRGKVYELYARSVSSSGLYGFVEVADLVFDDRKSVVVDPAEEKLRDEFESVKVLHLPMHSVMKIEEVEKRGVACIRDSESGEKVTPFPVAPIRGK